MCGGVYWEGSAQSAALLLRCGRARILGVFSADTTGQQRAMAEVQMTSKAQCNQHRVGASWSCLQRPRPPSRSLSGQQLSDGDLDVGSPASKNDHQQSMYRSPLQAEQQSWCFWARSARWPLTLEGPPLRRDAPAGDAPPPCTGGRAARRRRCPAAHPR